ncbi:MAG: Amidohydrolase family protein [Chloroflexota bacterium]|nr:Amidohydrolase family protein [Chloroflexota bacterium]
MNAKEQILRIIRGDRPERAPGNLRYPETDRYALVGATLFDGTSEDLRAGLAVQVEGAIIVRVCPPHELPEGIPVVDLTGCCVTPGLIDTHVHSEDWHAPLYLANGVTTVRDVGCALAPALARRKQWNARGAAAPRLVCCGPLLDSPGHTWRAMGSIVSTPEQAVAMVDRWVAAGVDQIKLYASLNEACFVAAVQRAHEHGKFVLAHLQDRFDARAAIAAGVDGIEHLSGFAEALWPERRAAGEGWRRLWAEPERDRVQRLVALALAHGTWLPVTRVVWHRLNAAWSPFDADHPENRYVPWPLEVWWAFNYGGTMSAGERIEWSRALAGMQLFTAALIEAGARVIPGSDAPFIKVMPGFGLHDELDLLGECGMSPAAALLAATRLAAQALGVDRLVGTIEAGKQADLLALDGDPVASLHDLRKILAVVRGGVWFRPELLLEQAARYAATAGFDDLRRFDEFY